MYQLARICYVHLEDVKAPTTTHTDVSGTNGVGFQQQRAKVKWFTRGWTLQELPAPWNMNFYDMTWRYLGTKGTLRPLLTLFTSINEAYLAGADLGTASIAKRMIWAEQRGTTPVGNVVYNPIGTLISISRCCTARALETSDVFRERSRETDDLTLFAWQSLTADTSIAPREECQAPIYQDIL
jgi:hypothetical protein